MSGLQTLLVSFEPGFNGIDYATLVPLLEFRHLKIRVVVVNMELKDEPWMHTEAWKNGPLELFSMTDENKLVQFHGGSRSY